MSKTLSKTARSRIMRDLRMLRLNPLIEEGIWVLPDETDITKVRVCVVGPEDSPYENAFLLFEMVFPENYPYSPPKARYFTTDGKVRMHPNYYCCGKVCVSIIGTWSGPGWTSCQTLSSVLLTFRSLFHENPLWQEPGFENKTGQQNTDYNELIRHESLRLGILGSYSKTPVGFEGFREYMRAHLLKHRDRVLKQFEGVLDKDGKSLEGRTLHSPQIFNFSKTINYTELRISMIDIYNEIMPPRNAHLVPELRAILESAATQEKEVDFPRLPYKKALGLSKEFLEEHGDNLDYLLGLLQIEGGTTRNPRGDIVFRPQA